MNQEASMILHLAATNDANGNPRRVFVVLDDEAQIIEAIDEGYKGTGKVRQKYPDVPISGRFETTVREYLLAIS